MSEEKSLDEMIAIELPAKYWIIVLFALEPLIELAGARLKKIRERGYDLDTLKELVQADPELVLTTTGPMLIRSKIVDALTEKGHMTVEAGEKFGTKARQKIIDRLREKYPEAFSAFLSLMLWG